MVGLLRSDLLLGDVGGVVSSFENWTRRTTICGAVWCYTKDDFAGMGHLSDMFELGLGLTFVGGCGWVFNSALMVGDS